MPFCCRSRRCGSTIVSRPSSISPSTTSWCGCSRTGMSLLHGHLATAAGRPLPTRDRAAHADLLARSRRAGLLTAQSIALALTAPALYALARASGASSVLAALPALLWLVCPFVASVAAISTMNALGSSNEAFARRFAGERGNSVGEAFLWMLEHPLQLLGDVAVDSLATCCCSCSRRGPWRS